MLPLDARAAERTRSAVAGSRGSVPVISPCGVEWHELHFVDARIETRDRCSNVEKQIVPRTLPRDRDRGQCCQMRIVLVGALRCEPVQDSAFLLQLGNQCVALD